MNLIFVNKSVYFLNELLINSFIFLILVQNQLIGYLLTKK
jgi:hypothetical protein